MRVRIHAASRLVTQVRRRGGRKEETSGDGKRREEAARPSDPRITHYSVVLFPCSCCGTLSHLCVLRAPRLACCRPLRLPLPLPFARSVPSSRVTDPPLLHSAARLLPCATAPASAGAATEAGGVRTHSRGRHKMSRDEGAATLFVVHSRRRRSSLSARTRWDARWCARLARTVDERSSLLVAAVLLCVFGQPLSARASISCCAPPPWDGSVFLPPR